MKRTKLLYFLNGYPWVGGMTVIFEQVYEDISKMDDIYIKKINMNLTKSFKIFWDLSRVFYGLFLVPFYDVISIQGSHRYHHIFGPILFLWTKLFGKKIILRTSAGNNIELYYERPGWFQKILRKTILNSDISFYETHYQVSYFSYISKNKVMYMPNNRKYVETNWKAKKSKVTKFVFLGDINERKGPQLLIDAFKDVVNKYPVKLDLIGKDQLRLKEKISHERIQIIEPFAPKNVYEILKDYDALILPSYREGMPGVIIEAFMLDIPVIVSNLPSIVEFVEHEKYGLIVKMGNTEDLKKAIIRLYNELELYNKMSYNIHEYKKEFDRDYWSRVYASEAKALSNE